MEAPVPLQAPQLLHSASSPHSGGNPAYIVAVFVVFACLLSLVAAVVRNSVCKGTGEVGANGRPSLRGIFFGSPAMSPGMLQAVTYRAPVESAGSTPRRGLLNDLPCSPGLELGVVKRLPMVCYKAGKHRRQGSGLREYSGRAGAGDGARTDSGRGVQEHGSEACSVCLCSFKEGDFLRVLPDCSHMFHVDCVDTWLLTRSSCPLCRCEVTGKTPSCSTKLGKLLARFGNGRSLRCSRSFSGQDLGSFRSRLGSDHGSFRSRLGTDQEAGVIGSNRFYEIDLGQSETEQRAATVIQIEDPSRHAADSTSEKSVAAGSTDIHMPDVQPSSPSAPRAILVLSTHVSTGMTAPADSQRSGSSEPISPGRLNVLSAPEQ